jgi:phospholipase/carboxylesterase
MTTLALNTACNDFRELSLISDGRLTAKPHKPSKTSGPGQTYLSLDRDRDAILQLPKTLPNGPMPLLVMLHGATQSAEDMLDYLGTIPGEAGVAILAVNSRDETWDAIRGFFSRDVGFINHALERTFDQASIDPNHVAIGGFSDGASYALSLGIINGDLFNRVVGFSPGFVIEGTPHGTPRFFISHGTSDPILPIDRCSRRIVADLKNRGYDVTFREFAGRHEVPGTIAKEAIALVSS